MSVIFKICHLKLTFECFLTGKNALFLVNMSTNNSQMYDLCAEDEVKRETYVCGTLVNSLH